MNNNIKAIVLLSGGLDSALAVKLVLDQGIDVSGVKFTSPFCNCDQKGRCFAKEIAEDVGIPFKMVNKGDDYLKVIRHPKFGYGAGVNPCIDCRIYMLKKTIKIKREIGAEFIITGEVLNQRPMSQYLRALKLIEKESGLEGKILRPLSAQWLPETEPEKKGWIDRGKLLAIRGRSRKIQLQLAKEKDLSIFACAAGGCLLTDKSYARKVRDLFNNKEDIGWQDMLLLKVGRHFRYKESKIIVGRNESENNSLLVRKDENDYVFNVPDHGSPTTLLQGNKTQDTISFAAVLTARYADCDTSEINVNYGMGRMDHSIKVNPLSIKDIDRYNIAVLGNKNRINSAMI